MSEYLWQRDAAGQELRLSLVYHLISESRARTKAESLTVVCRPYYVDNLRVQLLAFPHERSEDNSITNPFELASWVESLDAPIDEVRVETPEGVCRIYNLSHAGE